MRFAYFENEGRVSLSINDSTLSVLPVGAIALTEEQWELRFDLMCIDGELTYSPSSSLGHAEALYAEKVHSINKASEAAITGGFWSAALGEIHLYSSQLEDQLNLTGVILAGLDTLYACRDQAGSKDFRAHSFAQIRKVGDDFTAFKLQLLQRANALKQQLDQALAAGDLAALEAVTWESPQQ